MEETNLDKFINITLSYLYFFIIFIIIFNDNYIITTSWNYGLISVDISKWANLDSFDLLRLNFFVNLLFIWVIHKNYFIHNNNNDRSGDLL